MTASLRKKLLFIMLIAGIGLASGQEVHLYAMAFYNLENYFDTLDDPDTFDEDYTPEGRNKWTDTLFQQKTAQLAKVIAQIGRKETHNPPAFLGVAEAENRSVLEALVRHPVLQAYDYGIVHFESPDFRGIDVAFLYRKELFIVNHTKVYPLQLINPKTQRKRTTRDQLVVSGFLDNEELFFLINHWPSRRGGEKRSRPARIAAAQLQQCIIDSLQRQNNRAKIVSMGDFNDDPHNKSVEHLATPNKYRTSFQPLHNPMKPLYQKGLGSLAHQNRWHLFDQILISESFQNTQEGLFFLKAGIFNPSFLRTPEGSYKGYPYRNRIHGNLLYGYSDHFPVYLVLAKPVQRD